MVYFPKETEIPNDPKKCPNCGKWYVIIPAMRNTSCCVMHAPGSCCHFSEREVPEPKEDTK